MIMDGRIMLMTFALINNMKDSYKNTFRQRNLN